MSFHSIFAITPNSHIPQTGRKIKLMALTALSASIAACQGVPSSSNQTLLAEPNIPINQPYQIIDSDTISTNQVPNIVSNRWQDYYTDKRLKALIAMGLQNNKDMQSTILAIQKSRAQYRITDIQSIPTISGSAGFERSANNAIDKNPSNSYAANLAMPNYEFDFWGKIANLKKRALQNYLATNAAKDAAQIGLISNIAQAYVNLSYNIAQLNLATATVESREQSLFIAQERFKAGIDNRLPSLQAEASLENAKIAVYQAQSQVQTSLNALQYLIGSPVPKQLIPTSAVTQITSIQQGFNAGLPSELLYNRPDILQAEYALKAAGANIEVARAAYFPSISLSGRLGVASGELKDLFKNSAMGWSFGPAINLPIFDAGKIDADYHIAKIEQQEALINYEKAIQTAFKEVSDVLAKRSTLDQQLNSQYKLQTNFDQSYQIANARFKAGLSNYLDVLDSERSKFAAQQSILNLELAKVISQIQLYQVLGGGANLIEPKPNPATTETTEQPEQSSADTANTQDTDSTAVDTTTATTANDTAQSSDNLNDDKTDDTKDSNVTDTDTTDTSESQVSKPDAAESQTEQQISKSAKSSQTTTTKQAQTLSNTYSSARVGTPEEVEKLRQAKYPHSQLANKADDTKEQTTDDNTEEDTNQEASIEQGTAAASSNTPDTTTNVENTAAASPVSSQAVTTQQKVASKKPLAAQALVITETTRSKPISKPVTTEPVVPSKQTADDSNNQTESAEKEKVSDTDDAQKTDIESN